MGPLDVDNRYLVWYREAQGDLLDVLEQCVDLNDGEDQFTVAVDEEHHARLAMWTLAANLREAGVLCAADRIGFKRGCCYPDNSRDAATWRPGCGRKAP